MHVYCMYHGLLTSWQVDVHSPNDGIVCFYCLAIIFCTSSLKTNTLQVIALDCRKWFATLVQPIWNIPLCRRDAPPMHIHHPLGPHFWRSFSSLVTGVLSPFVARLAPLLEAFSVPSSVTWLAVWGISVAVWLRPVIQVIATESWQDALQCGRRATVLGVSWHDPIKRQICLPQIIHKP